MQERRKHPRIRTQERGKIIFNGKSSVVDCTVRNLSGKGACLQMRSTHRIPARFDLLFEADGTSRACQVTWMTDTKIGVSFG